MTKSASEQRLLKRFGWAFLVFFVGLGTYWFFHVPTAGMGGVLLAGGASLMPFFWEKNNVFGKFLWILMLFLLMGVEFKAIAKDRRDSDQQQTKLREAQEKNFKQVLKEEREGFQSTLDQSRSNFEKTISGMKESQRSSNARFSALLKKENELFVHEERLAESLNGRLIAGTESTPQAAANCSDQFAHLPVVPQTFPDLPGTKRIKHPVYFILGDNTMLVDSFPHVVLLIVNRTSETTPAITLDRSEDGTITITMDIRSADGRLVARLSKDGFVVNRNNYLEMRKDKSSLTILDEYGVEVLNARYLNTNTFSLNGILHYSGRTIPVQVPGMSGICSGGAGQMGADIAININ